MKILDRLTELESCATGKPWYEASCEIDNQSMLVISTQAAIFDPMNTDNHVGFVNPKKEHDCEFIVKMRNALPALLAVARAAKKACDARRSMETAKDDLVELHKALEKLEALDK